VNDNRPDGIIIPDTPLSSDQILFTQDLYSLQQTLAPGGRHRRVRETQTKVGKPWTFELCPDDFTNDVVRRNLDFASWRFLVICFFFDLEELGQGEHYREAVFEVDFEHQDATAVQLFPLEVTEKVQVERNQGIDFVPLADFSGIGLELGGIRRERRITFSRVDPIIRSHGQASNRFRWHFTDHPAVPLFPCNRQTASVLRLPRTEEEFHGTITCRATVRRRVVGVPRDYEAGDGSRPFTFRPADASFAVTAGRSGAP
jgi:hypothetical protein